jgi:hypothetical protein
MTTIAVRYRILMYAVVLCACFASVTTTAYPKQVFDAGNRSLASTLQLWPGLLMFAIALNLAELVMRKWKGLFGKSQ